MVAAVLITQSHVMNYKRCNTNNMMTALLCDGYGITEVNGGVIYPGEQRVQTVDFLPLGDVGVVLGDALQGQLLHQVDLIGLLKVLALGRDTQRTVSRESSE